MRGLTPFTAVTGSEVALLRLTDGRRVLRLGNFNSVSVDGAARIIAHTHPNGFLALSAADVYMLRVLGQRSSVLIDPVSTMGSRIGTYSALDEILSIFY